MDATTNDAPGVDIQGFPTIMLFKKGGDVVKFEGDRTVEGFTDFLIEQGAFEEAEEHSEL